MCDLNAGLRALISVSSTKAVHDALLTIMKDDYSFLKSHFSPAQSVKTREPKAQPVAEPITQTVEAPAAAPEDEETATGLPKIRPDMKIRIVKKAQPVEPQAEPQAEPQPEPQPAEPEAQAQAPPQPLATVYDSKDLKKWQKEQEMKKHAELVAAGKKPEDLLTADNLRKWIIDEKRTYAYVAREYIGLPEAQVSAAAKKHGIKSTITKKRAILSSTKPRS